MSWESKINNMVKKNPKFLLYKLEPTLERLEKINLEDEEKKEKYIENLFSHQNLESIFPDCINAILSHIIASSI